MSGLKLGSAEFGSVGAKYGQKTVTLGIPEMPSHGHTVYGNGMPMQLVDSYATDAGGYNRYRIAAGASQLAALANGGGGAHLNVQPTSVALIVIKT